MQHNRAVWCGIVQQHCVLQWPRCSVATVCIFVYAFKECKVSLSLFSTKTLAPPPPPHTPRYSSLWVFCPHCYTARPPRGSNTHSTSDHSMLYDVLCRGHCAPCGFSVAGGPCILYCWSNQHTEQRTECGCTASMVPWHCVGLDMATNVPVCVVVSA